MPEFVDQPSSDYNANLPYWQMVDTMLAGADAMRKAGEKYLPKFETESVASYKLRRTTARFTNIFKDIVENLAARPFSKEPQIKASANVLALLEDCDGQGSHISKFLANWFYGALVHGIEWCLVDYARTDPYVTDASGVQRRKTLGEERQEGARPFLYRIKATDLIAVYTDMVDGKEQVVHARIREQFKRRKGYLEEYVTQIRVLSREPQLSPDGDIVGYDLPTFEIFEQVTQSAIGLPAPGRRSNGNAWRLVDDGPISLGYIALYPLVIGERTSGWQVTAAMNDTAELQKEYFEQENGLKNIKALTAYPMLSASGVSPEIDDKGEIKKAPVGPRVVLYAPPSDDGRGQTVVGRWEIIEPAGTSLTFLAGDLKELGKELRELGRQPLTASSGNLTVITTAVAAQKGNSAIQNWALDCSDSAENALKAFAEWMSDSQEPEVAIDTDFSLEYSDKDTFTHVTTLNDKALLSGESTFNEAKRRGIISRNLDFKTEQDKIVGEMPNVPTDDDQRDILDPTADDEIPSPPEGEE